VLIASNHLLQFKRRWWYTAEQKMAVDQSVPSAG